MIEQKLWKIGRYEIIGEIGRGQMGVVYRAQDPTIGRVVALKVVHAGESPQPDVLRRRLQSEMKLVGKLDHPNIVTIHDAGEEKGDPFIAMEYLEGSTLTEFMESKVPGQRAIDIALQLCDALGYAHEEGVVHGDLKPQNIRIVENLQVKIADFGLARSIQASTAPGTFIGTLIYASPEQLQGDEIDGRSDIFSLGLILFEMLTEIRPFEDDDLKRDQPAPDRLDRIPSDFLRRVLLRALASDAGQRYPTCAALGHDLKRYQSGDTSITTGNPFVYGPPITEPQHFRGRRREVEIIINRLIGATPGSSAIIGGRRIGKTSLLHILHHPHTLREYGLAAEYVFVYLYPRSFSVQEGQPSYLETQFWQLILRGMCSQLPKDTELVSLIDGAVRQERITFNDFKNIVAATDEAGFKIVLLFDEFQYVVGNDAFPPGLLGGLRDLTQSYKLAFVTASSRNLHALSTREEIVTSPFWNVFTCVYLEPFNEEKAHDLVKHYTQKTDISFTPEDLSYVMRISGGHPYFLQLACWYVFDAYQEGEWGGDVDQENARQSVEEEFFRQAPCVKLKGVAFWSTI